jgi:hypothetical protein
MVTCRPTLEVLHPKAVNANAHHPSVYQDMEADVRDCFVASGRLTTNSASQAMLSPSNEISVGAGVKLCLLISGSERDAQYYFEDVRLRLQHVHADEHGDATDSAQTADAAASPADSKHIDKGTAAAEGKRFVLELTSMWPCRRGGAGVEAVPQEGAMYSHAPWLNGL